MNATIQQGKSNLLCGLKIITHGAVYTGTIQIRIQKHDGYLSSSITYIFIITGLCLNKVGAYHNYSIYPLVEKHGKGGFFVFQLISGTAKGRVISTVSQILFDIVNCLGEIQIGAVSA